MIKKGGWIAYSYRGELKVDSKFTPVLLPFQMEKKGVHVFVKKNLVYSVLWLKNSEVLYEVGIYWWYFKDIVQMGPTNAVRPCCRFFYRHSTKMTACCNFCFYAVRPDVSTAELQNAVASAWVFRSKVIPLLHWHLERLWTECHSTQMRSFKCYSEILRAPLQFR